MTLPKPPTEDDVRLRSGAVVDPVGRRLARHLEERVEDAARATIELGGDRYILVRAASMSVDFFDAVARMYGAPMQAEAIEVARSLQFDRAHALGASDARALQARLGVHEPTERILTGPAHFAHTGWAVVRFSPESRLRPDEEFLAVFEHDHSFEADAWLRAGRKADFPVCLMSAGYSSGWCEQSFGIPLVATETSCRARGDECCRFVMTLPGRIRGEVAARADGEAALACGADRYHIPGVFRSMDDRAVLERHRAQTARTLQLGTEELIRTNRELEAEVLTRRAAETALTRRLAIERLLAGISKQFISVGSETFDHEVDAMLRTVGEFVQADRAYVFQLREGGAVKDNTHEWCAPGVAPELEKLQGLPVHDFPLWMAPLRRLEDVLIRRVALIPDSAAAEREHLMSQGVQSMVLAPMTIGGELAGFLGFDAVASARDWRGEDAALLRMVADVLSNAVGRMRSDRALQHAQELLRQSQKLEAVGRLAGGVAHDFNNLLAVIVGNAGFLVEALPEGDPRRSDAANILVAAQRGARLTEQLLAFGRQQPQRPMVLSLNRVVHQAETMLRRLLGEHVVLETRLDPDLRSVRGDAHLFELVVVNLALNARDAMPEGGALRIETRNVASPSVPRLARGDGAGDPRVSMRVIDEGVGMDAATMSHIFEPFFTTKEVGRGTGLGLATVHGIVTQAGGEIRVQSVPGEGTTFEVSLPAVASAPLAEAAESDPQAKLVGCETILVVEDEEAVRKVACRILTSLGYSVLEAADGEGAFAIAKDREGPIDLLLADVVMPGMSGPAVHRQLEATGTSIPVVYMSGHPRDTFAVEGWMPQTDQLLTKPFSAQQLALAVRTELDRER